MTARPPKYSVLVLVRDGARHLPQALDSLAAQTDPDWEAVLVNGRTDGAPAVMERYAKRDARFRLVLPPDGAVAPGLNAGFREARGEWMCPLNPDDLFEPQKLEIHREWISKHPECRFFYSRFGELDDSSGEPREAPELQPPGPKWQVLEMLRDMFLSESGVCAHREAWASTGTPDESLQDGQEYDFFLRMLALHPAVCIPERTCVIRRCSAPTRDRLPGGRFFDSAKAAIGFLNRSRFGALVPTADLRDARQARAAVEKALEIAALPDAILYALGPHPALLWRIMEWAWSEEARPSAGEMQRTIGRRARDVARRHSGTEFGLMWKAAAVAARLPGRAFPYQEILPIQVAEARYRALRGEGDARAESARSWLEQLRNLSLPAEAPAAPDDRRPLDFTPVGPEHNRMGREVVFACQGGTAVDDPRQYGSTRTTLEVGKCLTRAGRRVLLVGPSARGMGFCEGLLFVGVGDMVRVHKALRRLGPVDTLIGISRADFVRVRNARRLLIYQQGPHPPAGASVGCINATRTPVVCVSRDSAEAQARWGIRRELLTAIHSGYSHDAYRNDGSRRAPHSWIFAGTVVGYKGVDIALRAFEIVRRRFPDATFHLHGRTFSWRSEKEHLLDPGWLDEGGFPAWPAIERAIPGVRYHGHVPLERLVAAYSSCSILVLPSRGMDTFGLVSVEAQACGCIPVLPRRCGFPETVREGATGYLYDENTPEALAAAVIGLWEKGLPADAQRQEAQEWARGQFSWEKTTAALLERLESTPARRGLRREADRLWFHYFQLADQLRWRVKRPLAYYLGRLRDTPFAGWPALFKRWRARQGKGDPEK